MCPQAVDPFGVFVAVFNQMLLQLIIGYSSCLQEPIHALTNFNVHVSICVPEVLSCTDQKFQKGWCPKGASCTRSVPLAYSDKNCRYPWSWILPLGCWAQSWQDIWRLLYLPWGLRQGRGNQLYYHRRWGVNGVFQTCAACICTLSFHTLLCSRKAFYCKEWRILYLCPWDFSLQLHLQVVWVCWQFFSHVALVLSFLISLQ